MHCNTCKCAQHDHCCRRAVKLHSFIHSFYLCKLDSIHNQGLRLALGAFRTSPVNSLYAEANEPSLNLRRKKLSLQYYLKLKSNRDNPTHKVVFEPLYKDDFLIKEKVIPPFSLRCEVDINCLDCDLEDVAKVVIMALCRTNCLRHYKCQVFVFDRSDYCWRPLSVGSQTACGSMT